MGKPYTVLAMMRARAGKETQLKEILLTLVEPTKKEEGCLEYRLHCDPLNEGHFMFYENFVDKKAHEAHLQMPYMRAWEARMEELLAVPVEVSFWEKSTGGQHA